MPVYLDCNGTTPLLPEVVDAMLPYLREHFGNPSSEHEVGRRAAHDRASGLATIGVNRSSSIPLHHDGAVHVHAACESDLTSLRAVFRSM